MLTRRVLITAAALALAATPLTLPPRAAVAASTNLIVNGDFEAGNTGFTAGYTYHTNLGVDWITDFTLGSYTVRDDTSYKLHPGAFWATNAGHTTGTTTDKYLMAQGGAWGPGGAGSQVVWQQTINGLTNGQKYRWCYYAADNVANWDSLNNYAFDPTGRKGARAGHTASIDGVDVYTLNPFPYLTGLASAANWVQHCFDFAATGTSVALELRNANLYTAHGNDWVLDDITLVPVLTASVSGSVWRDDTNDGVIDPAEASRLGGVVIELDDGDPNTINPTTVTLADGTYAFPNVEAGSYTIIEHQPDGYTSTTANSLPITLALDPTSGTIPDVTNQNFGELLPAPPPPAPAPAAISGTVRFDATGTGIAGVTLNLTGPVSATTVTAADGTYSFSNLLPGSYTVTEMQPAGLSDGVVEPDNTIPVTLAQSDLNANDFSEVGASIAGSVYVDTNRDGVMDAAEQPLYDVTIVLEGVDAAGNTISISTRTDANGRYAFNDLRAGAYTLTEIQPRSYSDVSTNAGSVGGDATPNKIAAITLSAGAHAAEYRFGELPVTLPETGVDVGPTLTVAFGFLFTGVALVNLQRRRRPA